MKPTHATRVSVVIPCYNSAGTVAEAIDSALGQVGVDVEVVVVNDGSSDNSLAILKSYEGRIVLVDQENRGLSAARNAGIYQSTGKYIALLDADDIFLPECLIKRVEIFEADSQIGLVAGYYREIDGAGNRLSRVPELRSVWKGNDFRQCVRRNWGPPVGWTFTREAFDRVGGFDPVLKSCEDWDFVIRVSNRYRIGYDETVQVLYRKSAGQMSSHHARMLDASRRVHLKNRYLAENRIQYWVDCQFGKFELGRRTLYAVLKQDGGDRLPTLSKLLVRYPHLLWVGVASAFSLLAGKRATAKVS